MSNSNDTSISSYIAVLVFVVAVLAALSQAVPAFTEKLNGILVNAASQK